MHEINKTNLYEVSNAAVYEEKDHINAILFKKFSAWFVLGLILITGYIYSIYRCYWFCE